MREKFYLLAVIVFASCINNNKNSVHPLAPTFFDLEKAILLKSDSLLLYQRTIELQFTDNSLIGRMPNVYVSEQAVFVFSVHPEAKIIKFGMDGQFQNNIGKLGLGPNEYIEPSDFFINEKEHQVDILTSTGISIYDFSGKFIKKDNRGDIPAFSFVRDSLNNYWFCTGNHLGYSDYKLHKLNTNQKIKSYLKSTDNLLVMQESNFSYNASGYITFRQSLSNKVFRISDGELLMQNDVDFGKYNVPTADNSTDPMTYVEELRKNDYCTIDKYFENEDYSYYSIRLNTVKPTEFSGFHWIIDKETNKDYKFKWSNQNPEHYLFNPQLLNENDELAFIGYTQTELNNGFEYVNKNPSIIFVPIKSLIEYAE